MTLTCIHVSADKGLDVHINGNCRMCTECFAAYQEDQESWIDYGDHPEGIERWEALKAEMDAEAATTRCLGYGVPAFDDHSADDYIPF